MTPEQKALELYRVKLHIPFDYTKGQRAAFLSGFSYAQEWQDISTAPKDGTLIDLWFDKRHPDCYFEDGKWAFEDASGEIYYYEDEPLYWMPLPTPPTKTA